MSKIILEFSTMKEYLMILSVMIIGPKHTSLMVHFTGSNFTWIYSPCSFKYLCNSGPAFCAALAFSRFISNQWNHLPLSDARPGSNGAEQVVSYDTLPFAHLSGKAGKRTPLHLSSPKEITDTNPTFSCAPNSAAQLSIVSRSAFYMSHGLLIMKSS